MFRGPHGAGPQERAPLPSPSVVSEQPQPPSPAVPGPSTGGDVATPPAREHSLPRKSPERTCWPQRPPPHSALKDESTASNTLNGLWSLLQFYSIVGIII